MKKLPAVTVLMPVYNAQAYLRQSVESILHQTFHDFEFLIIDDGSADGSFAVLRSYHDSRIRLIRHRKNKGLIATLNKGIAAASAPLVARMDADDVSMPNRLERQVAFLAKHPEVVLVGSDIETIDTKGSIVSYEPSFTDDAIIRLAMTVTNAFAHGSVVYRKEAVQKVGGYSPSAYLVEDYDLWARLGEVGKLANIPQPLYQWRLNPVGESFSKTNKQRLMAEQISDRLWEAFRSTGSAPTLTWQSVQETESLHHSPQRRRRIGELHIRLARGYFKRGSRLIALRHVAGALSIAPFFWPFYFYTVMPLLPPRWFFWLETRGLELMRKKHELLRGGQPKTKAPVVCLIQPTLFPEASRVDIYEYSQALAKLGVRTHVIVCRRSGRQALPKDLIVHELSLPTGVDVANTVRFVKRATALIRRIQRQESLDLVHLFNPAPATFLVGVRLRMGLRRPKVIYDVRTGGLGNSLDARIINSTASLAAFFVDGIITLSRELADRLFERSPRHLAVVPLGVNISNFKPRGKSLSHRPFCYLYAGTLHRNRRLVNMLEAFALVHADYKDTRLLIAGDGNDRGVLERWVNDHTLSGAVKFLGKLNYEKVPQLMQEADCGLSYVPITPWFDPQPQLKTLEYLATNLPTVATATAGNVEVWQHLPPPLLTGDRPEEFAAGMRYALERASSLRTINFRQVAKEFDWQTIVRERLLPFYQEILAR